MRNKMLKYLAFVLLFGVIGYNSVTFKSLSAVNAVRSNDAFDAPSYARKFWETSLTPAVLKSVSLNTLIHDLKSKPDSAFSQYSHALGIGNIRYFLLKGEGSVVAIEDNRVILKSSNQDVDSQIRLETEFVYGNAVRDAVGTIHLTEFTSTADLNQVSQELNKIIRSEIVPPFLKLVKAGDKVQFAGALELNRKYFTLDKIEIIPVSITIQGN